jgi:hypothetical protein
MWIAVPLYAQNLGTRAWDLERQGQASEAQRLLRSSAAGTGADPAAQKAYAEFLEQHRDPDARAAWEQLLATLERRQAPRAEQDAARHHIAILSLLLGDRLGAERQLTAVGQKLPAAKAPTSTPTDFIEIPGPFRSFARMAAFSPDLPPEEVLPAVAHNIVMRGYRANLSGTLGPTEYLTLVQRYLSQARELEDISDQDNIVRIDQCDSAETGALLRIIGYRLRGACGAKVVLETVNGTRAFITTDSGFPLSALEDALRGGKPFVMDMNPTTVPLLYSRDYWQPHESQAKREFIDYFLGDPSIARLYTALSKLEPNTAGLLHEAIPAAKFKLYAHVLDFFGAMFVIRDGRALVPGGSRAEGTWGNLAGASPNKGSEFFQALLAKDDGWLASYFDSLARISGPAQDYLLEPKRLTRFYEAIHGKVTSPGPARPVFQSNTEVMLLTTRLRIGPDGSVILPGGLDVWKRLFTNPPDNIKDDAKLRKDAALWKEPDQVLEALFGLSRRPTANGHLTLFMLLTDLDRFRREPLPPALVETLARRHATLGAQYPLFAASPNLSPESINKFFIAADRIAKIGDEIDRADAAGVFQGLLGLWQIFVRQDTLAPERTDAAFASIADAFKQVTNDRDIFDAGRSGITALMSATRSPANASLQERMLDLLAGTSVPIGSEAYQHLVREQIRIFEAQRLVPLDTLFQLADNLEGVAQGTSFDGVLAGRLANRVSEIQLPQGHLSLAEKTAAAFGYWTEKHIDAQRKINLRRDIEKASSNGKKLADLRGSLTPFLRDTLVGFNYMHYAPPGAQILYTNPLFVRSHEFTGVSSKEETWTTTRVFGSGWPSNAGGRLVGSLIALSYALAEAEQNFLVPAREQALVWDDLAPQMLLTSVLPRWWNVSPAQIHWVGLHLSYGESALAEAVLSPTVRTQVMAGLSPYLSPRRLSVVNAALDAADVQTARDNVMPSEMYLLARQLAATDTGNATAQEIGRLAAADPAATSPAAISRAFGTPKPTLANSYQQELLNLRTFPTLMGYSSRILAETWESNLIYFAALADQIHVAPDQLNVLVPQWTQRTLEHIFASNLEDWPALLRSLRLVGEEVQKQAQREVRAGREIAGGNAQW